MRLRHAPFVALVLLLVPAIAAQTDPADDRIRAEMKRQNIPGLSLAVGRTFAYWGTGVSVPAHIVGALIGLMGGHAVLYGVGYPVVLVLLLSRATPSSGMPGSVEDPEPQTGTSHDGAHLMSALAGRS